MSLLRVFIRKGFCPTVIRNGRKIILMELKSFEIRFICRNNYFNCDEYSLANQYKIQFNQIYFPSKFTQISNFSYDRNTLSSVEKNRIKNNKNNLIKLVGFIAR